MDISTNEKTWFCKLTNHKKHLCYVLYLAKQTPEFHWVTAWGYIMARVPSWSIRDKDEPIFMVQILSKRLIHHLTILAIRKVIFVKSYAKMTSSSLMPQTLGQDLHCPSSWYNTTMRT